MNAAAHERIRVIIADDHAVLRAGLKMLIERQQDIEVVGEAQDGRGAVEAARSSSAQVAIMDLGMDEGGLTAIRRMRAEAPGCRILVLTMFDDPATLKASMAAGAAGFVTKSAADSELLTAVRAIHAGRSYIGVPLPAASTARASTAKEATGAQLSPREEEVLAKVAQGFSNKEVAQALELSVKTIETYRARISEKLGLRGRAELVRYALRMGLLGRGEPRG